MYQAVNNVAIRELNYRFSTIDKLSKNKKTITNNSKKSRPATIIKTVLVVEDNPIIQTVIGMFLKQLGYSFDIASNGKEALALYSANRYSIIFMDIELPDTNGIAITENIRANRSKTNTIPIVAMTSRTDQACKDQCLLVGMNEFFNKPTSIDEVKAIISKYVK